MYICMGIGYAYCFNVFFWFVYLTVCFVRLSVLFGIVACSPCGEPLTCVLHRTA